MDRSKLAFIFIGLIVVIVLALGGVTACGQPAAQAPTPTAQPRAGAAGGELRLLGADPPTLDPHLASDSDSATYIVEVFGGLVMLDHDLKVVPDIAKDWEISSDGKTYTFHLKEGVKFHSGKVVTADDFKYSLERALDPKTASTTADTYLSDIVGAKDKLDGKAKEVAGVKVLDKRTLELTIEAPRAYFVAKLTYPTANVLDKENVESSRNWMFQPNGTGPFKLKEYRRGERLVLERNPYYHLGPARLERVMFILSGGSTVTMYENNEIDISGVGLTDIERVLDIRNPLNRELRTTSDFSLGYIGFNTRAAPFDDVRVRQALSLAVDKAKITSVVLQGLVEPAYGILPLGFPGYNPDLKGLKYDLEQAKRLIAESRYGSVANFPRITMTIPGTGATLPPSTEAIMEMWKQGLGLEVEIQQSEWATFLRDVKARSFQAYELGWVADYVDPQNFLDILLHSKSFENYSNYSNPEFDRLIEQARGERDGARRIELYRQAEEIAVRDAPLLPLWFGKSYLLVKPQVKGYFLAPMVVPVFKDVYLER